ncbi:MAG TPA: ABC transporter permease, partial [Pseudonocardiaceae bacterium]
FAVTVLTRHGIIPLIVFIANSSVVSVGLLLAKFTTIGKFVPDVAGSQMFAVKYPLRGMLSPAWGGIVMGLWTVGLLGVAATVFARRDA